MTGITTHVLDTARGRPAAGIKVQLARSADGGEWAELAEGVTDANGRITDLATAPGVGTFRLRFELVPYFEAVATPTFFPYVEIVFRVDDAQEHYHVPLLLNPFGFSTYRGS